EILLPGRGFGYGMGVVVEPNVDQLPVGVYTWMGGFGTSWFNDPAKDLSGIRVATNGPICWRRAPTTIVAAMIGTAIAPLITALQNNALIGSMSDQVSTRPNSTAAPITP